MATLDDGAFECSRQKQTRFAGNGQWRASLDKLQITLGRIDVGIHLPCVDKSSRNSAIRVSVPIDLDQDETLKYRSLLINMRPVGVRVLLLVAGVFGLAHGQNADPRQINPPFGLYWAEGQKEIAKVLDHAGARVTDKANVQGRDAWTVEGLIQPALKRTILYFGKEKTLVEVELQYQHPGWDLVAYEEFLNSARQRLEALYGPATVLARDRKPEGDIMQTIVGFQWQQQASSIQLFFFSAERNNDDLPIRQRSLPRGLKEWF